MIELTDRAICSDQVLAAVASKDAGAVCLFLGTAREFTGGLQTVDLEYEAYGPMALQKLAELEATARGRWPVIGLAIVHRTGRIGLGETAVAVAVSTPHRREAFEACQWLMDTLKAVVPIWKKERWSDGRTEWIHPAQSESKA
jgi:molybdopterin synthase catalytic subunit